MGKPLSRPDCLRKRPRCLGKREDQEGYIEDCYVPQRSIYDTMRINEQIDQGSGGGEDSTLSSNGTLGTGAGGTFEGRSATSSSTKRLDERVIFDSLKLTVEGQSSSPAGGVGSVSPSVSSTSSGPGGAAAVNKRWQQSSDKKDHASRRSWKTFMPPEFAERLEVTPGEAVEKPLTPLPLPLSTHTPPLISPYSGSPISSGPRTPPVSCSPSQPLTPAPLPAPLIPQRHSQPHTTIAALSPPSSQRPQCGRDILAELERRGAAAIPLARLDHRGFMRVSSAKASDSGSERDSPVPEQDNDTAPLLPPLVSPQPEAEAGPTTCTWPRRLMGRRRTVSQGGVLHKLPILPPLPPLLAEHSEVDEESLHLLDTPSSAPPVQGGTVGGRLPAWSACAGELRERSASELRFEEDERKVLEGLEEREEEEEETEGGRGRGKERERERETEGETGRGTAKK